MSAKVMRTLESGVTQPERGRREIGQQGKFSLGQPGERSRQGANHGGHQVQPKRMMVQRRAQPLTGDSVTYGESMRAVSSKKENKTGLPDRLKAGIENLSGYSMDDVRVHYNSEKPAQLQALAYAQGTEIHVGPGQEKHLPHEAWHVVQQKQGRVKPTRKINGKDQINEDAGMEREADNRGKEALSSPLVPKTVELKETPQTKVKQLSPWENVPAKFTTDNKMELVANSEYTVSLQGLERYAPINIERAPEQVQNKDDDRTVVYFSQEQEFDKKNEMVRKMREDENDSNTVIMEKFDRTTKSKTGEIRAQKSPAEGLIVFDAQVLDDGTVKSGSHMGHAVEKVQ
ncbi:MAG: DUF4157 domain-containing protein [Moorea sp. SIOASIH]|nr:DUF4157 domain-containing protein [Moorena sp. SIOASIH]